MGFSHMVPYIDDFHGLEVYEEYADYFSPSMSGLLRKGLVRMMRPADAI